MIEDTQLVIFRRNGLRLDLYRWALMTFRHVRLAAQRPPAPLVRDAEAERFLQTTDLPWLFFLSGDHAWGPEADPLLTCPEPVAGCRYLDARRHEVHPNPGEVGAGCIRIHRDALAKIAPPWFTRFCRRGRTARLRCSCETFGAKARAVGILPEKVGSIGHRISMVAHVSGKLSPDDSEMEPACDE